MCHVREVIFGKCLDNTDGFLGYGKKGHKMRDCLTLMDQGREAKKASLNDPDFDDPRKNHFYVLQAKEGK